MTRDRINNEYFEWLYDLVCHDRFADDISYRKLFMHLHSTKFIWSLLKDENRANDGLNLRYRFVIEQDYPEYCADYISGSCSVLEMMIALALRCEENIMDDTRYGDRTAQWFWGMVASLGLGGQYDDIFNRYYVEDTLRKFLHRDYSPTGEGGLFIIKNPTRDLRDVEIWIQLCWYLDGIIGD